MRATAYNSGHTARENVIRKSRAEGLKQLKIILERKDVYTPMRRGDKEWGR